MGTDRYGEKKTGFDHITLRTNPYKSVQKNVQSTRFIGRLSLTRAAYRQAHWLGHSNGAAGAFLGLIGLLGLIGQRLTEWQALFKIAFRGAAPALRFNE